jgi:uncharacterized protein HemX
MVSPKRDEHGFGHLESILIIFVVVVIGLVGWYVYHAKQNTDKALNTATTTSNNAGPRFAKTTKQTTSSSTSNASLQADQQSASTSANQGVKDLSDTNNSLNDQSTFTAVPQ